MMSNIVNKMRIVITKNGKILVQELEDESPNNYERTKLKYNQSSSYTKLPIISTNAYECDSTLSSFNPIFSHSSSNVLCG